jgi:hypothetical protein
MKQIYLILLSALSLSMWSCTKERIEGDGPVVSETRPVNNFSGIDLRVSANVYYKQDTVYKLEVSAQQNILDVMETYVSNGKLVVKFENDVRVHSHDPIVVMVSGPSLSSIRLSGSGNVNAAGKLLPATMDVDISGSGDIFIAELNTAWLDANISGSGNITIGSGSATEEKLTISGSGNIDLTNVQATKAKTKTSGSGDIRLSVSQSLDVTISGSGSVYYKGNPYINTNISGSGKVIHF